MIDVNALVSMHDDAIARWKKTEMLVTSSSLDCVLKVATQALGFLSIAEENHGFNYQLWHAEDRARRDDQGHSFVYWAKREIDWCNQQRNDRVEAMDAWISKHYAPAGLTAARVNSETPGMMIDRLSILALKIYHMAREAHRQTADDSHRAKCLEKWQVLCLQRQQLVACLLDFLEAILDKTATYSTYHQFKMYNDKALNPELYGVSSPTE